VGDCSLTHAGFPDSERLCRAVFLDRDGVINRSVVRDGKPHPPRSVHEFEIYPEVSNALWRLKDAGYVLVVVTNQPDVGRGVQDVAEVEAMHNLMCGILPIDRIEVCYETGFDSASEYYKPAPGMILHAAREMRIDVPASFIVGDRWRDVDCGWAAGCRTIFIDRGYQEPLRRQPHYKVSDLMEAARVILEASLRKGDSVDAGTT
jgi:D-glycero-D-manno-heptose 1,7-bisphosphate phosphatase